MKEEVYQEYIDNLKFVIDYINSNNLPQVVIDVLVKGGVSILDFMFDCNVKTDEMGDILRSFEEIMGVECEYERFGR